MIEVSFVKEYSRILSSMYQNGWEFFDYLDDPEKLANAIIEYMRSRVTCHPYDDVCRPGASCRNHGGVVGS